MEFLKETLGEELYTQFAEKMNGSKIKLADISGGEYVGRDKFNSLEIERNGIAEQLSAANAEIKKFQDLDIDSVKAAAADWETKFNKAQEDAAAQITDMEYSAALKDALAGVKFTSNYAAQGVHAEIKAKKLPRENGKIIGIDDALKSIREAMPDAFAPEKAPASVIPGVAGNTQMTPPTSRETALQAAQAAMGITTPKG